MSKLIHSKQYLSNESGLVGSECICPSCGVKFIKGSYQQVFCKSQPKTVCKDKYWNRVDPSKRNNTTRISPASQDWIDNKIIQYSDDFDPSWDAHKI